MKRLYTAVLILAVLIGTAWYGGRRMRALAVYWETELSQIKQQCTLAEYDAAEETCRALTASFAQNRRFLACFIKKPLLDELWMHLHSLEPLLGPETQKESLRAAQELLAMLQNFRQNLSGFI